MFDFSLFCRRYFNCFLRWETKWNDNSVLAYCIIIYSSLSICCHVLNIFDLISQKKQMIPRTIKLRKKLSIVLIHQFWIGWSLFVRLSYFIHSKIEIRYSFSLTCFHTRGLKYPLWNTEMRLFICTQLSNIVCYTFNFLLVFIVHNFWKWHIC